MSSTSQEDTAAEYARKHYNSQNAQKLYDFVVGGDTLNLGLYDDPPTRSIGEAMKKTTEWMAERVNGLNADFRILDIGAGYGPASRHLAKNYGCRVTCLNISEEQNARNESQNREQGLDKLIEIVPANFKSMPLEDGVFDVAWTQDALFHTDELEKVLAETYRVLKPGGQFMLMDIMQADDCPPGALEMALRRVNIHHERIGSIRYYQEIAQAIGFECLETIDLSEHLLIHYTKWRDEVINNFTELSKFCSPEFLELTKVGMEQWVETAEQGLFKWGLFHFRRP